MKSNVQNKARAIQLRMQGFSYSEIMKEVPVAKGTLSGWLKRLELTTEQEKVLYEKISIRQGVGRAKGAEVNRSRRLARDIVIKDRAYDSYNQHSGRVDFIMGLCLYWAEGSKRDGIFSFINSDAEMIVLMYQWMQKYLQVPKESIRIRLFIHDCYKEENLEAFWAQQLDIDSNQFQKTIYKPTVHQIKKNPTYKGCLRMYVNGIHHLHTVLAWKESMVKTLKI